MRGEVQGCKFLFYSSLFGNVFPTNKDYLYIFSNNSNMKNSENQ